MTAAPPFRVAVVGAGPAGFYLAERLLARGDVEVDLFDRLPAPYGLVRYGVAPDHEKIRNVTRVFDRTAANPRFRFFGNVEIGRDVAVADLRQWYDQVAFTTGAQTDRRMGIPGEDLGGSHTATEFVAWYNGHPDYHHRSFDLSAERVVVVGAGNVAVDVARILCRTPEELATTDIADHAIAALRRSRVREVVMLGRRGPAQAAFTNAEVKELGELPAADVRVVPDEVALDPLSRAAIDAEEDTATRKKIEILEGFARRPPAGKARLLTLRFLVSPVALTDDGAGRVRGVRVVRNRLEAAADGSLRAVPTGDQEDIPAGLVFRSVGYRGVAIAGLPFDERGGTVPNRGGRVIDPGTGAPLAGLYVAGWIKRGPSGVIGTNKPDAGETADAMLADLTARAGGGAASAAQVRELVRMRQRDCVGWADWLRLQAREAERGRAQGRPRVKCVSVEEMRAALGAG
ncbi:MAG TPA: FAD-dependent oxidoreductase [Gemmatimonadales bacterium]|nr:FAD-dependent oxidoreductase [Gemmatimonadales bacterium]